MNKLFSFISALILLSWLSLGLAQDRTEPGKSPNAPQDAGGGIGPAPEASAYHEQPVSDAPPNGQRADVLSLLAEQEKDTDAQEGQFCLHCNANEQLVVDLNYYKQITDILKGINENYKDIGEEGRKSIHDMVARINPNLVGIVPESTEQDTPKQIVPGKELNYSAINPLSVFNRDATEQSEEVDELKQELALLKQELSAMKRHEGAKQSNNKPRQNATGLDGLKLKHVNEENPVTGARARIVVGSHRETKNLSLNSKFKHNENEFVVKAIEKQGDDSPDRRHLVTIENTQTGETHNIPW